MRDLNAKLDLCLRDGKIVLEKSLGTNSESLFHTLCYRSQMDNTGLQFLTKFRLQRLTV